MKLANAVLHALSWLGRDASDDEVREHVRKWFPEAAESVPRLDDSITLLRAELTAIRELPTRRERLRQHIFDILLSAEGKQEVLAILSEYKLSALASLLGADPVLRLHFAAEPPVASIEWNEVDQAV